MVTAANRHVKPIQRDDLFQLCCAMVNATSWSSMKVYLQTTRANVVLGAEMHTIGVQTAEASQWAINHGWKSIWEDAIPGADANHSIGGVAIFARSFLGLSLPPSGPSTVVRGRVVSALVNTPGTHGFVAYAGYFVVSEGLSARNLGLLQAIGEHIAGHGRPFVCGADFNFPPEVLASTSFASKIAAQIVHPDTNVGTCFQGAIPSTIDYYVVSGDLVKGLCSTDVDMSALTSPHRPAMLMFHPCLTNLQALSFCKPPALPRGMPIGCKPPAPDWEPAHNAALDALRICQNGQIHEADEAMFQAYEAWANTAEQELAGTLHAHLPYEGSRGGMPKMVWKSILQQEGSKHPRGGSAARLHRWGAARAKELWLAGLRMYKSEGRYGCAVFQGVASAIANSTPDQAYEYKGLLGLWRQVQRVARTLLGIGCSGGYTGVVPDLLQEVQLLQTQLQTTAEENEGKERAEARAEWAKWVEESIDKGAGAVHRWAKVPVAWRPTTTLQCDGTVTSDPLGLLRSERDRWSTVWGSRSEALPSPSVDRSALPRLRAEEIREASLKFNWRTSISVDGFHVRHFALLEDPGLEALAVLLEAMETIGRLPPQVKYIIVLLLEKATGGFRPIGLFCGIYRVWGKARRAVCSQWEASNDRSYFAAGMGRSASDAVWRQSVLAEAGVGADNAAAAFLWDITKYYEQFNYALLQARAHRLGFPVAIFKVVLFAYKCARHISYSGAVTEALFASNGIIAGCFAATSLTRVYAIEPFDEVCRLCPTVTFDFFVDDLTGSKVGSMQEVECDLVHAAHRLKDAVEVDLRASIAIDKAAVVASSQKLAQNIRTKLGPLGGTTVQATRNLGIDYAPGKCRGAHGRCSARAKRFRQATARRLRLSRVCKVVGLRAKLIFSSGVASGALYGAEVHGVSNSELLSLQRTAASAMRPTARGRSLAATLLINGDPTWRATAAPIVRWAKEVWEAAVSVNPRGLSLSELARVWRHAAPSVGRQWRQCRGPPPPGSVLHVVKAHWLGVGGAF